MPHLVLVQAKQNLSQAGAVLIHGGPRIGKVPESPLEELQEASGNLGRERAKVADVGLPLTAHVVDGVGPGPLQRSHGQDFTQDLGIPEFGPSRRVQSVTSLRANTQSSGHGRQ